MASWSKVLPNAAHSTQGLVQENQTRLLVPGMVTPPPQIAMGPGQRDPETFSSPFILSKLVHVITRPANATL